MLEYDDAVAVCHPLLPSPIHGMQHPHCLLREPTTYPTRHPHLPRVAQLSIRRLPDVHHPQCPFYVRHRLLHRTIHRRICREFKRVGKAPPSTKALPRRPYPHFDAAGDDVSITPVHRRPIKKHANILQRGRRDVRSVRCIRV